MQAFNKTPGSCICRRIWHGLVWDEFSAVLGTLSSCAMPGLRIDDVQMVFRIDRESLRLREVTGHIALAADLAHQEVMAENAALRAELALAKSIRAGVTPKAARAAAAAKVARAGARRRTTGEG